MSNDIEYLQKELSKLREESDQKRKHISQKRTILNGLRELEKSLQKEPSESSSDKNLYIVDLKLNVSQEMKSLQSEVDEDNIKMEKLVSEIKAVKTQHKWGKYTNKLDEELRKSGSFKEKLEVLEVFFNRSLNDDSMEDLFDADNFLDNTIVYDYVNKVLMEKYSSQECSKIMEIVNCNLSEFIISYFDADDTYNMTAGAFFYSLNLVIDTVDNFR